MVAAGPPPSRLGQTSVQETVSATRTALLTLAGSDRLGCAIGAAAALLLDWDGVSEALAGIAQRLGADAGQRHQSRSEEHTSELQSLMRISYAVFCLKKKKRPYRDNNMLYNSIGYQPY